MPALAISACLGITGCGGSAADPLSAAQLASQGSAICERAESEERALNAQNAQGMREAIPHLEEIGSHEQASLSKLSPPPAEQSTYHEFLSTASELVGLLKPLGSALASGETPPPELLAHGRELAARAAALDRPLGMSACSTSTSPGA
jgi:hypothetical protein